MAILNRYRNILDFALSSLARRKGRNLSLLAAYTLIVFLLASVVLFITAIKREATLILKEAPDMVVQNVRLGRHDLIPVSYSSEIAAIRGVGEVRPRLWGYYYDATSGANYTVMAAEMPAGDRDGIVIGSGVARIRKVAVGDLIPLPGYDGVPQVFVVRQILPQESELATADLILLSEQGFCSLFQVSSKEATDLAVTVANPAEQATIAGKIVQRFPAARPILKSEILRTYESIFDWRGGMVIVALGACVLAFVIFAWDKASGLSAEERREIGILKSIGWETADVLLLKLAEGIIISLTAFLVGVLLAYGHVFYFSASLFESALKGWSVLYPRFRLVPVVDFYQLSVLFFLTVIPYTAATIVPSWRAAITDPDVAMRS